MCGRFLKKLPGAEIARIFGTRNAVREFDRIGIMRTMAMEGRSVIPRTVTEEVWKIARASAPLIDREAKASERIDQFRADLADALNKFKWTRAETENLILELRLRLRAVTKRGSTNVADSNVFQAAVDRLGSSGRQPSAPTRAKKNPVASARYRTGERTPIPNRMPVILPRAAWSAWLSRGRRGTNRFPRSSSAVRLC